MTNKFDFLQFIHADLDAENFILENKISDETILANLTEFICYINAKNDGVSCGLRMVNNGVEFYHKLKPSASNSRIIFNNITTEENFSKSAGFDFNLTPKRQTTKHSLNEYVVSSSENNVFIHGAPHSGKTKLLITIANTLMSKKMDDIALVNWPVFLGEYRDFDSRDTKMLEKLKNVNILFLDCFGEEAFSEFGISTLHQIISYRSTNNLRTIIASNSTIEEFRNSANKSGKSLNLKHVESIARNVARNALMLEI